MFWTLIIIAAWTGWGFLLCLLLPRHYRDADWGLIASWGMAVSIALGGLLNLSALMSPGVGIAFVVLGSGSWIFRAAEKVNKWIRRRVWALSGVKRPSQVHPSAIVLPVLLGLLLYTQVGLGEIDFNDADDFHAYLVFPLKMLNVGWLTLDPFNYNQMTALGGQAFLQDLFLATLPVSYIHLLDLGACLIICSALVFGYQRQHKAGPWSTTICAAIPLLSISSLQVTNASASTSLMTMYLALYRTFDWTRTNGEVRDIRSNLVFALVAAALIALKSNSIPYVAFLLLASYLVLGLPLSERRAAVHGALRAIMAVGVFLLPWMVLSYLSGHTLLYPFLGMGYSGSAYGTFPKWSTFTQFGDLVSDHYIFAILVLSATYLYLFDRKTGDHVGPLIISIATISGTLAILWATAGESRYTVPFSFGTCTILLADITRQVEGQIRIRTGVTAELAWPTVLGLSLAVTIALSTLLILSLGWTIQGLASQMNTLNDPRISTFDDWIEELERAQDSVPKGAAFLAVTRHSFLLNFVRNRVFVVDAPYGSSPAPGMPFGKGGDALADYLQSNSIRYVLFEISAVRGDPRCLNPETAGPVLSRRDGETGTVAYECAMDLVGAEFVRNLNSLLTTRENIYRDDKLIMLDLSRRR